MYYTQADTVRSFFAKFSKVFADFDRIPILYLYMLNPYVFQSYKSHW